ncbi:MAG: cyclodeaminase/cyclohydrolase family protein [Eggerthellaceae bacterium]|nr:cyclodeaminase/cyclohydrolase family protein [Eggerthellaceae bacterium]
MSFQDMSIKEFLTHLSAKEPVPGGGCASALAGAQGVALLMMVANYTVGNPKFADLDGSCNEVLSACSKVFALMADGIQADADAFKKVSKAFKNPTDKLGLSSASIEAAEAPLAVIEAAGQALAFAEKLLGASNPMLESDIADAVFNLDCCIKGAYINVKVNLPYILDEEVKRNLHKRAIAVLESSKLIVARFNKEFNV